MTTSVNADRPADTPRVRINKMDLTKTNPVLAARLSKAVRAPVYSQVDMTNKKSYFSINQSKIKAITDSQNNRLRENDDIFSLFPDIQLGEQILVSNIVSPKDGYDETLVYRCVKTIFPSKVQTSITEAIRSTLTEYYKFGEDITEILKKALFRAGSYVSMVLPEAAVDHMVNGSSASMESINSLFGPNEKVRPLGIMGNHFTKEEREGTARSALESLSSARSISSNSSISLEGFQEKLGLDASITNTGSLIEITDNIHLLKMAKESIEIGTQRVSNILRNPIGSTRRIAQESGEMKETKITADILMDLTYKANPNSPENIISIPGRRALKRKSFGRATRMEIPPGSIVPIFQPGEPELHRAYLIIVDAMGNWVTKEEPVTGNSAGLAGMIGAGSSNELTSAILNKSAKSLSDKDMSASQILDNMSEIFGSVLVREVAERSLNSAYGTKLDMLQDQGFNRIMISRALAGKQTRMVFVPKELITYYAFMFHANGLGKSFLDQIRTLTSLRGILLFSKIMAEVKNAINVTNVNMNIDPTDPDPRKTIEIATHDIIRMREAYFPVGMNSPTDLMEFVNRAGLQFTFTGHDGIPNTSFEFSTGALNHQIPDNATSEDLRKQTFMTFSISPDQVDRSLDPDQLATTAVQQNALFAKRIAVYNKAATNFITEDARNIVRNDSILRDEIRDILKANEGDIFRYIGDQAKEVYTRDPERVIDELVDLAVDNMSVELPKPNTVSLTEKAKLFTDYSNALDPVIQAVISDQVAGAEDFGDDFATQIPRIAAIWKNQLLRDWMANENFLPEVMEILKRNEDGNPAVNVLEIMKSYTVSLGASIADYMKHTNEIRVAMIKDAETVGLTEPTTPEEPTPPGTPIGTNENPDDDQPDFGGQGQM